MAEKIEVILVDLGNSMVKSAEVAEGEMGATRTWENLEKLNSNYPQDVPMMVCSTRDKGEPDLGQRPHKIVSHQMPLPIKLDYKTPETLGTDRIAAAVGAMELFPNQNSLIIDLGTCMTIDLVDAKSVFRGGIISPGLMMRMKSMSDYTTNLPDISKEWEQIKGSPIGKSTKECLYSGSFWGLYHEIKATIEAFEKDFTSLNVILTGGDAHFFESTIKAHIFAGSKIVQTGLYRIWKY